MNRTPRSNHPAPAVAQPASSVRPYAKGLASGMLLMGLIGCLPDEPKASMAAVAQPRDVRVQLPPKSVAAKLPETPADVERDQIETPQDDFAPRRASMQDLGEWITNSAAEAPQKLEELNRKTKAANEALAAREPAPSARREPPAAPRPAPEPIPTAPEAPAAPAPATTPVSTAMPAAPAPVTPAAPTADSAAVANAATVLANAMSDAIAKRASAQDLGRPVTKAVAAAIGAISDPERRFDLADFPGLDEEEATFVTKLHEASAEVGRDLAAGKPLGEAVAKLADAIKAVEPAKPLLVKRSEFATRVDGFGQLQPIANRRFLPGRENQVILYNELDGFTSDRNEKNEWVTTLATKIQILAKHDGTEVWSRNWLAVTDTSSVRRGDFFVCEKVVLSEYLTVGTYILKTSVRDERTGAIAEKSVEFSMVADPALAAR